MCGSYDELCDILYKNSREVATQSVQVANTGSYILLVKRFDSIMGDRVLSVSRLEPLEYFILKEIRTSLKSFLKQTNDKQFREIEAIASTLK